MVLLMCCGRKFPLGMEGKDKWVLAKSAYRLTPADSFQLHLLHDHLPDGQRHHLATMRHPLHIATGHSII